MAEGLLAAEAVEPVFLDASAYVVDDLRAEEAGGTDDAYVRETAGETPGEEIAGEQRGGEVVAVGGGSGEPELAVGAGPEGFEVGDAAVVDVW